MTSFEVNQIIEASFRPTFKIQRQIYLHFGFLLPTNELTFLQVYFIVDNTEKANFRKQHIPNLYFGVIDGLRRIMHDVNAHVNSFKTAMVFDGEIAIIINFPLTLTKDRL